MNILKHIYVALFVLLSTNTCLADEALPQSQTANGVMTIGNSPIILNATEPKPVIAPKKRRQPLPGLDTSKTVTSSFTKGSVIRTKGDGTEIVLISKKFPNRIATPFDNPRVIDKSKADIAKDGSSMFISPTSDEPFVVYVTGAGSTDPVISLTLIPKDIPAQTISLQLDSDQHASPKKAVLEGYTQQIMDLLRTVAVGKTPEGFSEGLMPNFIGNVKEHGLMIIPVKRYSGSNLDIYKYKVENSLTTIELSETSFYRKGVRAVSITPNTILNKGESTFVYVLADKSLLDESNE